MPKCNEAILFLASRQCSSVDYSSERRERLGKRRQEEEEGRRAAAIESLYEYSQGVSVADTLPNDGRRHADVLPFERDLGNLGITYPSTHSHSVHFVPSSRVCSWSNTCSNSDRHWTQSLVTVSESQR